MAEMIAALEGPIALTECTLHPGACPQEASCHVRTPWQRINRVVRGALARVTLAELVAPSAGTIVRSRASAWTRPASTPSGSARPRRQPWPNPRTPARAAREPRVPVRLRHRHRGGDGPARARRGHRPPHLGEEERAGVAARVAAQGATAHWLDDETEPHLGERPLPADRLPGHHLLLGAEAEDEAREPRRGRSRAARAPTRSSASRSHEQKRLAGVAVDAVFDSVSVATTFKDEAREARASSSARSRRRCSEHPELVQKYLGLGRARTPTTSSRRSTPRSSPTARSSTSRRACAARWSSRPTSASTPPTRASSSAR